MKGCTKCGNEKNDSDFYIQKSKWGDRLASWCKACVLLDRKRDRIENQDRLRATRLRHRNKNRVVNDARSKEWHKQYFIKHPHKRREYRIKSVYGITPFQFHDMIIEQENRCATCGKYFDHFKSTVECVVDHCHTTNKVRGLLCQSCNTAIGYAKDNVETLERMIKYLIKSREARP